MMWLSWLNGEEGIFDMGIEEEDEATGVNIEISILLKEGDKVHINTTIISEEQPTTVVGITLHDSLKTMEITVVAMFFNDFLMIMGIDLNKLTTEISNHKSLHPFARFVNVVVILHLSVATGSIRPINLLQSLKTLLLSLFRTLQMQSDALASSEQLISQAKPPIPAAIPPNISTEEAPPLAPSSCVPLISQDWSLASSCSSDTPPSTSLDLESNEFKSRQTTTRPVPLLIIGSLFKLGNQPHRSLTELAKTYGPLMTLKLGHIATVVVSSSSIAKEVLQKNDLAFANQTIPDAVGALNYYKVSMVWLSVSTWWRNLRKNCNEQMFTT
ncbi:hypothetical protein HHK36_027873 [Tetracentron sinense]|uniref:Cytochrome P450 n=1 Tax=Tetracentron sinense TaxID=13715 RepID=A0A834YER4_TETSI|nr:hypothetical protein HHK36_027873 [Tetracentron sinense]